MYRNLILIALGVAVVGLSAAYWLMPGGDSRRDLLAHVPADTVVFTGHTDPSLPWAETFSLWGPIGAVGQSPSSEPDPAEARREGGAGAGMLAGLYGEVAASLAEDEHILQRFGVAREHAAAGYTVGALPVLRVGLDDPDRFWQRIDAIESTAGIEHRAGSENGTAERRYAFDTGNSDAALELLIATRGGYAVVTLTGSGIGDAAVAVALGDTRPDTSLRDSGRLDQLADRHDTLPTAMGFIDHQRLVAGLSGDADSRFGDMLRRVVAAHTGDGQLPGLLANERCRRDAQALARTWPYTAFGVTRLDTNTREMGNRIVVAINDDGLIESLQGLRGHIPEPLAEAPMLGFGLGLDAATIAPTLTELSDAFASADFECAALQQAQQRVGDETVSRLGMVTAMVRDVRGVAVAVQALGSPWRAGGGLGSDAVIEVATNDPEGLWQFAQSTLGLPAKPRPEAGGEPVPVTLDRLPLDAELRVAIRDNTLVALVGDARLDDAAGEADLEPNGVMRLRYDYAQLLKAVAEAAPNDFVSRHLADADALEAIDVYYDTRLDMGDAGIRLDIELAPAPRD